jgi:hypothetical protein
MSQFNFFFLNVQLNISINTEGKIGHTSPLPCRGLRLLLKSPITVGLNTYQQQLRLTVSG